MTIEQQSWMNLYRDALLELDHDKLRQRIQDAHTAIRTRLQILIQGNGGSPEERQAIRDALNALDSLQRALFDTSQTQ